MTSTAEIILPLAIDQTYTYLIPEEMLGILQVGMRVEVPFGKSKTYSGMVMKISDENPTSAKLKYIQAQLDEKPIVNQRTLKLWQWISDYYLCTIGEVMLAGLAGGLKLVSETILSLVEGKSIDSEPHSDDEYLILEALELQKELTIAQVQKILNKKSVLPIIQRLIKRQFILSREELPSKYKPKTISIIRWHPAIEDAYIEAIDAVKQYEQQENLLLTFITLSKKLPYVTKSKLIKTAGANYTSLKSLIKKGFLLEEVMEVSRIGDLTNELHHDVIPELNEDQLKAKDRILELFNQKSVVLLHGVTGSGKTRVYFDLIQKTLSEGKQVLYLLPEIALTRHFIHRLKMVFGEAVQTYHSQLGEHERVEVFQHADKIQLLVGPRSAVFLPFTQLGLIIVDESHDYSYKQQDPAPRYHGRDTAIVLGSLHKAQVLLGTATPSTESMYNVQSGKFGYVTLKHRVNALHPPTIELFPINQLSDEERERSLSNYLIAAIQKEIVEGRQVLLFRNRRGYAPVQKCQNCGWTHECIHCDVSLTYHKWSDRMQCHYCGYRAEVVRTCPQCGSTKLQLSGIGTQRLEEAIRLLLPDVQVDRLDADSVRGKARLEEIFRSFESGKTDILIGTQMITKGIDFENVGLVGVTLADSLLYFPDFRSEERAHQVLMQVAGRAGRQQSKSRVIIQTYQPTHPVFESLTWDGQRDFYQRLLQERKQFSYPPFIRFIEVRFIHQKIERVERSSRYFVDSFQQDPNIQILGPVPNYIPRIKSKYIMNCIVKIPKTAEARHRFKNKFMDTLEALNQHVWGRSVYISVNVDPY